MVRRKKVIIKREEASVLRPKKLKPFNPKEFMEAAKRLEEAIKKEEEKYGSPQDEIAAIS